MGTTYRPEYLPATRDIRDTFTDEVTSLGGTVPDAYDDGSRLFLRAVLPLDADVLPGDRIRGGVAVRVTGAEILVHPYTFRMICSNGAIVAHALSSERLDRTEGLGIAIPTYESTITLGRLRDAVRACASRETFTTATHEMRSTALVQADLALHLLPAVAHMPAHMVSHFLPQIFQRFADDGDNSVFGLLNAVTSVARDARDPDARWRLEELGGSMPARLQTKPRVMPHVEPMVCA